MRKILAKIKGIRVVTKPIHAFYVRTPHIEHGGFVMLAASEVFHLASWVLYVNIVLMISGAGAIAYETFHLFDNEE